MKLRFEVKRLAPSFNGSKGLIRMHYHAYRKLRDSWTMELMSQRRAPLRLHGVHVRINRFYAKQPLDLDNLYASCKIPLDALRHSLVLRDDDPEAVLTLSVKQEKVSTMDKQKTVIWITSE